MQIPEKNVQEKLLSKHNPTGKKSIFQHNNKAKSHEMFLEKICHIYVYCHAQWQYNEINLLKSQHFAIKVFAI
jgi:hypothetical protein